MPTPTSLDQIEAERVEWLWPINRPGQHLDGRVARGILHVFAGKAGQGKGLTTVRIGADLALAGFNVLHSAIEDSPGLMTKPRYQAAGLSGEALKRVHTWRFRLPERQKELEEYVVEHNIDCIIIDPLASSLSNGINRHSDRIREVTDPLTSFIETTPPHPAVIVVDHVLKRVTKNSDPLAAIGGSSSGVVAASRLAYIVGTDPEDADRKILCHIKHNICEQRPAIAFEVDLAPVPIKSLDEDGEVVETDEMIAALLMTEECVFDPMRILTSSGEAKIGRPGDKRAQAAEWLTTYLFLAGQPVPSRKVFEDAKQYGMTEKTLRRAAADLNVLKVGPDGKPAGGGQHVRWELPDEIKQLLGGGDTAPEEQAPQDAESPRETTVGVEPVLDPDSPDFDAEFAQLVAEMASPEPDPDDEDDAGDE